MPRPTIIRKSAAGNALVPNWTDYEAERRSFDWNCARKAMEGLPDGALNIAYEAVDRHAKGALSERITLIFCKRKKSMSIDKPMVGKRVSGSMCREELPTVARIQQGLVNAEES